MAFVAAVLEGGHCACLFGVGKACLSNVFVADLKLGTHELNEAHFVNKEDIGFLKNLNVCDGLPSKGEKTHCSGMLRSAVSTVLSAGRREATLWCAKERQQDSLAFRLSWRRQARGSGLAAGMLPR